MELQHSSQLYGIMTRQHIHDQTSFLHKAGNFVVLAWTQAFLLQGLKWSTPHFTEATAAPIVPKQSIFQHHSNSPSQNMASAGW
jgi:hypothetical protein